MSVVGGLVWKVIQQYSTYFFRLLFQIVLARLLSPKEFGILAEMLVFITVAEAFANGGFGTALIQKKDSDELDFSTSYASSIVFSIILYIIVFFSAPRIASFYKEDDLAVLLRLFGLSIPFYSINSIQNAMLMKSYRTKELFIASFLATVVSGIVAVYVAYRGGGAYSLVIQSVLSIILTVSVLQVHSHCKPIFGFSWSKFKSLFSFSWKIVLSTVFGNLLENSYNLFIGKMYSSEALGYYNRGNSFPNMIIGQLRTAISSITLPYFANSHTNNDGLIREIKEVTHFSVLITFPMAFGLAVVAEPLVRILLTDKWLPCVFFLQIECIFYGLLPISASVSNGLLTVGRSDLCLKFEMVKMLLTIISLVFIGKYGIIVLCICRAAISGVMIFLSVAVSRKVIGYGFKMLLRDVWLPFVLSIVMSLACIFVGSVIHNVMLKLVTEIVVGFISYGLGLLLFMHNDYVKLKGIVENLFFSHDKAAI